MTGLFFALTAFVFGTVVGSFLNVCIYRLPRGESLVYPPSHCPRCYQHIRPDDNIPVLSWFMLGGRCRSCGGRISLIYPVVEFLTGALFFLYYWKLVGLTEPPTGGQIALFAVYMAFVSALLASSVIDFKHLIIPDEITLPGLPLAVAASAVFPSMHPEFTPTGNAHLDSFLAALLGAAVGAGVIYGIGVTGKVLLPKEKLAFGGEAMGIGDVKFMAMIGAVMGWQLTMFVLCASAFVATIYGLVRMAFTGDNKIAYGPFLAFGAATALLLRAEVYGFLERVIASYSFLFR